jgi:regulator of protease activity HflC (stomatin/prohibitin superfamily)
MRTEGINAPAAALAILLAILAAIVALASRTTAGYAIAGGLLVLSLLVPFSLRMARQWERAVVLRLGKLQSVRGPGMFFMIPFVDAVAAWIDQRIQTTEFAAEQALTADSVPANIDAVLFWQVHDVERAALEISDYREAILRVAQTTLREMIGASSLSSMLTERKRSDARLRAEIGEKTREWGVSVISVEIRDVAIPPALQDAMSRQAQAERERAARVTLGAAEKEIAQNFLEAANTYASNPAALQLRAMNIIYETTKERGATILVPSTMVDSLNPVAALAVGSVRSQGG